MGENPKLSINPQVPRTIGSILNLQTKEDRSVVVIDKLQCSRAEGASIIALPRLQVKGSMGVERAIPRSQTIANRGMYFRQSHCLSNLYRS